MGIVFIIIVVIVPVYVAQLIIVFLELEYQMYIKTKREFLLWLIPFYMIIINIVYGLFKTIRMFKSRYDGLKDDPKDIKAAKNRLEKYGWYEDNLK